MRRFSQVVLWGGLGLALSVGSAPAQLLSEIIRAAVNEVPSDMFGCGDGSSPCGLSYRMIGLADPSDINGSANPVDGIPAYRAKGTRYAADAQITANFPVSGAAGAGFAWYVLWDGQTGAGSAAHTGWYGTQGQIINNGELGNSLSFNCLPVIAQEACFPALEPRNGFNDTVRADGSALSHVGGISPIPCPTLSDNGLSTLTYNWEEASNNTSADGVDPGVTGYDLYLLPDPLAAPSDADLGAGAVQVASSAFGGTSAILDRSAVGALPGLVGSTIYSAALKLSYVGGHESLYFSCNSAASGVATLGAGEIGDAPSSVDVQQVFVENRTGSNFLVVTLKMAENQVSRNLVHYYVRFDGDQDGSVDEEVEIFGLPAGASRSQAGSEVLLRFTATFDAGDLEGNSFIDDATGRVQVVIDADNLAAALGSSSARITGLVQIRSAKDDFDSGVHSF